MAEQEALQITQPNSDTGKTVLKEWVLGRNNEQSPDHPFQKPGQGRLLDILSTFPSSCWEQLAFRKDLFILGNKRKARVFAFTLLNACRLTLSLCRGGSVRAVGDLPQGPAKFTTSGDIWGLYQVGSLSAPQSAYNVRVRSTVCQGRLG